MANQPSDLGLVVWHDLLTDRVDEAKEFYGRALGWEYHIEHAEDFAWRPGEEADYPLIMRDGVAHGGIVEAGDSAPSHWLAWVAVPDVDRTTRRMVEGGGRVERQPFDVPGVGRGAVVSDPWGAKVCPFVASHSFPPPEGVFRCDELRTPEPDSASVFYSDVFGWSLVEEGPSRMIGDVGSPRAIVITKSREGEPSSWTPYLSSDDLDADVRRAQGLGARLVPRDDWEDASDQRALLADPTGAMFGLVAAVPKEP